MHETWDHREQAIQRCNPVVGLGSGHQQFQRPRNAPVIAESDDDASWYEVTRYAFATGTAQA
eukprot:5043790-Prymnesium_polylepis.1